MGSHCPQVQISAGSGQGRAHRCTCILPGPGACLGMWQGGRAVNGSLETVAQCQLSANELYELRYVTWSGPPFAHL